MPIYNKLVRDKIPEIIEKTGRKVDTRVLTDEEYYKALIEKLSEEVTEFSESGAVEEMADILEVMDTLLKVKGISLEHVRKVQEQKRVDKGGFEFKLFLKEVIE